MREYLGERSLARRLICSGSGAGKVRDVRCGVLVLIGWVMACPGGGCEEAVGKDAEGVSV